MNTSFRFRVIIAWSIAVFPCVLSTAQEKPVEPGPINPVTTKVGFPKPEIRRHGATARSVGTPLGRSRNT